jgi:G:T-mismatch repair DNA endonuclease (very short patch repair protein)
MMALFRTHGITGWRRGGAGGNPICPPSGGGVCRWLFLASALGRKFAYTPKSRLEFWLPKFDRNVARDRLVTRTLRRSGWTVVRVWECELAKAERWPRVVKRVQRAFDSGATAERR